jgi:uncharacterized protein (UPF0335 family)
MMSKTNQTLTSVYQSMLKTLIDRRAELVKEIEDINEQIVDLKKEAQDSGVSLTS